VSSYSLLLAHTTLHRTKSKEANLLLMAYNTTNPYRRSRL